MTGVAGFIAEEGSHDTSDDNDDLIATQWIPHSGRADRPGRPHPPCPHALMSSIPPCDSGRADRPRSADGMGSGFISRSDDVPDLMSALTYRGPAGTLVPTGANEVRERFGDGGWRLGTQARETGPTAWGLASPRAAMACLTSCQGPTRAKCATAGTRCPLAHWPASQPASFASACPRVTVPACPLCLSSTQHSVLDPALFPLISTPYSALSTLSSALLPHPFNRFNTFSLPRTRSTPCRWAPPPCPETA